MQTIHQIARGSVACTDSNKVQGELKWWGVDYQNKKKKKNAVHSAAPYIQKKSDLHLGAVMTEKSSPKKSTNIEQKIHFQRVYRNNGQDLPNEFTGDCDVTT